MMTVRTFDLTPGDSQMAVGVWWSKIVPVRGAREIAIVFYQTGGGAGTIAQNYRFGDDSIDLKNNGDLMIESGVATVNAGTFGGGVNSYAYTILTPIGGPVFLPGFFRFRWVIATAAITGVQVLVHVLYEDGMEPGGPTNAQGAGVAEQTSTS